MANRISQEHKLGKQNRKRNDITNYLSEAHSSTSNSHEKFNHNIDITSKEWVTIKTHYSTNSDVQDKPTDIIKTEPVSIPHNKNNIDTNITAYDDSQSF